MQESRPQPRACLVIVPVPRWTPKRRQLFSFLPVGSNKPILLRPKADLVLISAPSQNLVVKVYSFNIIKIVSIESSSSDSDISVQTYVSRQE
ncbi:hypothetical protein PHISCL_01196 [Aspergillus sclerotialis]|uniref:Uncharacterized protein n=1 Tax=Aspergillus sclerotialis TaxID=2070753 RepID=A0A3A2ZTT5_9EURO|nr:hypothetical protein PHISCL_01196 [Aspergillus sclerotialis]